MSEKQPWKLFALQGLNFQFLELNFQFLEGNFKMSEPCDKQGEKPTKKQNQRHQHKEKLLKADTAEHLSVPRLATAIERWITGV